MLLTGIYIYNRFQKPRRIFSGMNAKFADGSTLIDKVIIKFNGTLVSGILSVLYL
jgi:hypothetical protein